MRSKGRNVSLFSKENLRGYHGLDRAEVIRMKSDMKKLVCGVTTMLLLAACGSNLTPRLPVPTPAEVEQYNAVVPYEEQIVCLMETELGSRFRRRVCYTRGYLESRDSQGQAVVDAMKQDGLIQNPIFQSR